MHVNTSNPDIVLTHRNVELDEAQAALTSRYGMDNTYRGGRVIHVASSPEGRLSGLAGDRARLRAPAASGVDEWVCTTAGLDAAAVWEPRVAVGK